MQNSIALAIDTTNRICDIWAMDWKTKIKEIQACGMSQSAIGAELGKSQAWVADVLRGRYEDLKWTDGQALIVLHQRVCGTERKAA